MIVFLDFDGVTHPVSGAEPFQRSCLSALKEAFSQLDASIVITSTWRLDKDKDDLQAMLGKRIGERVIGVTPDLDIDPFTRYPRAHEVVAWLESRNALQLKWVAIDDEKGNYPEGFSYLTNNQTGFCEHDIVPFIELACTPRSPLTNFFK